ncbi:MAG: DHA2 family efflux MFS transporter permease subunit [Nitrospirae bacterium]|nr:DHA2 family efflux MFS transporter permease subunit [Nitrospirota bacterium]
MQETKSTKWLIALAVMLPTLIEIIDTSVVNVSLNHIRGALSAGIDESTWTITAYLVSNAIVIPMSGWLSRLIGRKKYLITSIIIFTTSSFLCGSAWSLHSLVFFRILQGIGGGGLVPLSQAILLEAFPPAEHGIAMAIFGFGTMFGPIVGPFLGGWITDNWSWRWIFYINIPIGIIAIILNSIIIKNPHYMTKQKMTIDYWGLTFLITGLGSIQYILDKGQEEDWLSSPKIQILSIVFIVSFILLIINELYHEHPIINLRLFKDRTYTMGNMIMFFTFFNLFGSIVLLPIFLESMMGYTSFDAGLVLGPGGAATLISMQFAGRFVNKINPKLLLGTGIIICSFTTYLMSQFNLEADFWTFVWPRITLGLGMGLVFIPLTLSTLSHIPREKMSEATSLYNLLRNMGGSVGIAFSTTMIARKAQFYQTHLVNNLTPYNSSYMIYRERLSSFFSSKGLDGGNPDGMMYRELIRQSNTLAFNETFMILSIMMLGVLVLITFLKITKSHGKDVAAH